MNKIIVATHHKLAEGFKETLNYISPNTVEIIAINAYVDNQELSVQIDEALSKFEKDEQIFVFTDLLGGSVNQEFAQRLGDRNIKLITGANLPIILTIALNLTMGELSEDQIDLFIKESKEQLVYVNDVLKYSQLDDEDDE